METIVKELVRRLIECIELSVGKDKIESIKTLIERHSAELLDAVGTSVNPDVIKAKFSNFINKTLSTVEALGLNESQYKATRKLILSEINGCATMLINKLGKEINKEVK